MLKHWQVSVHITHPSVLGFYRDPTVNLGHSRGKDWQLHLWHAFSYELLTTYATIFRLILISSNPGKSLARSGGLNLNHKRGQLCTQLASLRFSVDLSSRDDLIIGATALHLGFDVVTLNVRHFQMIPSLSLVQF